MSIKAVLMVVVGKQWLVRNVSCHCGTELTTDRNRVPCVNLSSEGMFWEDQDHYSWP